MNQNTTNLLLDSLTEEQLYSFLREYASAHPEFGAALFEKFAVKPSGVLSTIYYKEVDSCFYYPKDERDLEQMDLSVTKMMARAHVLKDNGDVGNFVSILLRIIENILLRFDAEEHYACFDDWYPLQMTIDDLGKELKVLFIVDDLSEVLRKQVIEQLERIDSKYENDYLIFDLKELIKALQ